MRTHLPNSAHMFYIQHSHVFLLLQSSLATWRNLLKQLNRATPSPQILLRVRSLPLLRRMFGCDVPVGLVYSINPFMIIFLVPIVGALTTHYNHFEMIHLGGYVSALAPFWMVAFTAGTSPAGARTPRE